VSEIIGREAELALLHSFIGEADREPASLVLEGEAGIGKSTLWFAGVERARAQRLRVVATRPVEAERGLAHVGLADLFEGILDDVLPELPASSGVDGWRSPPNPRPVMRRLSPSGVRATSSTEAPRARRQSSVDRQSPPVE